MIGDNKGREETSSLYAFGLGDSNRNAIVTSLRQLMSNLFLVYVHALNCHWNLIGPQFGQLHLLFEKQYEMLFKRVDELAERIRTYGGAAPATLPELKAMATLSESDSVVVSADNLLRPFIKNYLSLIRDIRILVTTCNEIQDHGTANFLTSVMEDLEKGVWLIRSHVE